MLEDGLSAQALADLAEEGEDAGVLGALALGEDEHLVMSWQRQR